MLRYRTSFFVSVVLLAILFPASMAYAQGEQEGEQESQRVRDIRQDPQEFLNEVVTLEGFVTQYVDDDAQSTSFYFLKDDYGALIRVRTSRQSPETGARYRVTGPVGLDPESNEPYVSEETRIIAEEQADGGDERSGGATTTSDGDDEEASVDPLLVAIAIVFVVLIGVLVWVIRSRRQPTVSSVSAQAETTPSSSKSPGGVSTSPSTPKMSGNESAPDPAQVVEDKTIKMHAPPPGTLKILPGQLKVTSGLDEIKDILLYRSSNGRGDGTEITIGRASGKPYQHIQLKPRTVSSKQAKLVYTNNKFMLINYASESSNPTQINGKSLDVNESVQLQDGDEIQMGEVTLRFSEN